MIETEAKIRLNRKELTNITRILGKPNFFLQENIIFQLRDSFLRIRKEKSKTIITYKGKRIKSSFKKRREIEFEIKTTKEYAQHFLSSLGFKKTFSYKKKRAEYKKNNCTISLDILSNKNIFIEIEGNEKNITKNLNILNLKNKPLEKRSYQEILNEKK